MNALTERIIKVLEATKRGAMDTKTVVRFYDQLSEQEQQKYSLWKDYFKAGDFAAIERTLNSQSEIEIGNFERAIIQVQKA